MAIRYLLCPKCKERRLFIKNSNNERLGIYVTHNYQIIPMNPEKSIEGFDTSIIYCLGCSWKGTLKDLVKY